MNTNLLLIAGAAVAYALLRPKATSATTTSSAGAAAAANLSTGGNTYVHVIPRPTSPTTSTSGGLLNNAGLLISQGTALVTAGATAWDTIKDALHLGANNPPPANNGGNVWAGPNYNYQDA